MATSLPSPPKSSLNPLWVIFLFFSFTETVLGIAAFQTTGGIQVAFTWFALAFPTVVAAGFFVVLWFKPQNFYGPGDYKNDVSFVESMRIAAVRRQQVAASIDERLSRQISETMQSEDIVARLGAATASESREILRSTAEEVKGKVEQEIFFSVDLSEIKGSTHALKLPIDAYGTFNELTDDVYFAISDKVRPFHYGKDWVLRNKANGSILKHARMITGAGFGTVVRDLRPLVELGISAGTELEAVPPKA